MLANAEHICSLKLEPPLIPESPSHTDIVHSLYIMRQWKALHKDAIK